MVNKIEITLHTGSVITFDHLRYYLYISAAGVMVVKSRHTDKVRAAYPQGAWVKAENSYA